MKKYLYDLGDGYREHSISEIANKLGVNKYSIQEILDHQLNDIEYACLEAKKEKETKKKMRSLLKRYTTDYLLSKNFKDVYLDDIELKNKKERFMNTFEFTLEADGCDYVSFSKEALNLLLLNTDRDLSKPVFDKSLMNSIRFLKLLTEKAVYENENVTINLGKLLRNDVYSLDVLKDSIQNSTLTLSSDKAKILLDLVNTYRLPMKDNDKVFDELSKDLHNGKDKNGIITYIKK